MQSVASSVIDHLALTRTTATDGTVRLAASGEIDICNVDRLRAELESTVSEPDTRRLTLDLAGLEYIDSMGVSALIFAARVSQRHGVAFTVVNAQGHVLRVLKILGLHETLTASM